MATHSPIQRNMPIYAPSGATDMVPTAPIMVSAGPVEAPIVAPIPEETIAASASETCPKVKRDGSKFRDYKSQKGRVADFYRKNHEGQTVDFVEKTARRLAPLNSFKLSIWDAFKILSQVKDDSDPDTENSQLVHGIQTAESLRRQYPDLEWLHLVGLIHDLGKVLTLPCFQLEQWAIVGDTFPVGCEFSDQIVYPEYFANNPDTQVEKYSTKYGIYNPNCGLMNLLMSYGHDEFLYQVLTNHYRVNPSPHQIPIEGLYVIRFHSFYAWHRQGAYSHLANEFDHQMLPWIHALNRSDLYSKDHNVPNFDELHDYYKALVEKYIPGVLSW